MEKVLDPGLPICDPHRHLWARPDKHYTTEEFKADTNSGHLVLRTVFVECMSSYRTNGPEAFRPVGETEFVVAADPDGSIAGIVGFADLRLPEIDDVLAAHAEAGAGRFRGIRQPSCFDPSPEVRLLRKNPPGLLGDASFRSGFTALGRAGLSFDAFLFHTQLHELTDLARAHADVPIILDHLGVPLGIGPYRVRHDDALRIWRSAIRELATCPNVVIKLGGIGMPIFGMNWHEQAGRTTSEEIAAAWGAEMRWCIEQFGVDRCMFESNFPPDGASCSYVVLWNAYKRMTVDASSSEKAALFHNTAARVYRIAAQPVTAGPRRAER